VEGVEEEVARDDGPVGTGKSKDTQGTLKKKKKAKTNNGPGEEEEEEGKKEEAAGRAGRRGDG